MDRIKECIESRDVDEEGNIFINKFDSNIDNESKNLLDEIINIYKVNTGIDLSNWTHEPDSPWHKTWFRLGGKERDSMKIQEDEIKNYFIKLGKQNARSEYDK